MHDMKAVVIRTDLGEHSISTSSLLSAVSSSFNDLQVGVGGSAIIESSKLGLPERGGSIDIAGNATLERCTLFRCGESGSCTNGKYQLRQSGTLSISSSVIHVANDSSPSITNMGGRLRFSAMELPSLQYLSYTLMSEEATGRRRGSFQFDKVTIHNSPDFGPLILLLSVTEKKIEPVMMH